MLNLLFSLLVITIITIDETYGQIQTLATVGQFKYVASVWHMGSYTCGGAVISKRHIITAGHCVYKLSIIDSRVLVGVHRVMSPTKWHQVQRIYVPVEYEAIRTSSNPPKFQSMNDIGIIKLLEDLVFDDTVQPIARSILLEPLSHQPCEIAFYRVGENSSIKKIDLSLWWAPVLITSNNFCATFYSHVFMNQLCIWNPQNPLKPIAGDSGSPVTYGHQLFGIVQSAEQNGYAPVIITLIAPYERFIEDVICERDCYPKRYYDWSY